VNLRNTALERDMPRSIMSLIIHFFSNFPYQDCSALVVQPALSICPCLGTADNPMSFNSEFPIKEKRLINLMITVLLRMTSVFQPYIHLYDAVPALSFSPTRQSIVGRSITRHPSSHSLMVGGASRYGNSGEWGLAELVFLSCISILDQEGVYPPNTVACASDQYRISPKMELDIHPSTFVVQLRPNCSRP
jgi:hypothetical protein